MSTTAEAAEGGHITGYGTKGYRNFVLGGLLIVYIFNFIDRTIVSILAPQIIEEFALTDFQFGLLAGFGFAVFYTLLGIPIAQLSERMNRVWIIGISCIIWSGFTAATGLASGFIGLLIFRIGVGIGEAGCTPPANSLIGDYFPAKSRAQALSVYAMGITLGFFVANIFVGLGGRALDWRTIFIIVGLCGVPIAILVMLFIKEPPRGYSDPPGVERKKANFRQTLKELSGKPTFWHVAFGSMLASFVGYGLSSFVPTFLVRTYYADQPLNDAVANAALFYGAPLALVAAFGTVMSGAMIQRLTPRFPRAILWVPAVGFAFAAPAFMLAFNTNIGWVIFALLVLGNLGQYLYLGPLYAVGQGVVGPESRATAVAIELFIINLIALGVGPPFVGWLSDVATNWFLPEGLTSAMCSAGEGLSATEADACAGARGDGLRASMTITMCMFFWGALHFLLAMKSYKKDMVAAA